MIAAPIICNKNIVPYDETWKAMRAFCDSRDAQTADQIWLLQHPKIYTLGQAGKLSHLLRDNGIPLVRSDRGGQITYHGPGQIVAYLLLDIRRRRLGLRALVRKIENAVISVLGSYEIVGSGSENAPGVYVRAQKIAALGLRVRHGCTYHGLALNVNMDLTPFKDINPCGYAELSVTQIADCCKPVPSLNEVQLKLSNALINQLA